MLRIIVYILIYNVPFLYGNVISVTSFKNNTPIENNNWIGEMISDNLTSDLSNFAEFQIINRNHLKDVLKEQELNYSGLVSEDYQNKLGELIGAQKILRGDYTILNNILIINALLVDIESGESEFSVKVEGQKNLIYVLVKQLTYKILGSMGIQLGEIEKLKMGNYDTDNIDAIEKNYLGIIALDNNEIDNAIGLFREAIEIDPFYKEARYNLKSSEVKVNGGLLFSDVKSLNDKKIAQRNALELIYNNFIDNYLSVEIINQKISSNIDDSLNAIIQIEFLVSQNTKIAEKFINDLRSISAGDSKIFRFKNGSLGKELPDELWLILNIKNNLKKNYEKYSLYSENYAWFCERIKRDIRTGLNSYGFKKKYRIQFLNRNKIINEEFIYTALHKACYGCWAISWYADRGYGRDNYSHLLLKDDNNLWSYQLSEVNQNKYPSKHYLDFHIPLEKVKKMTSINIEVEF